MKEANMRFLGWSNILINGENSDLVFDPFYRKMYGADWARAEDYDNTSVICVSHGHHEHYLDTPALAKKNGAIVVSSPEVCEHLHKNYNINQNQLKPVMPYEEVEVNGFKITAFDWHHRPINYLKFFQGSLKAASTFMFYNIMRSPWKARYYGFVVTPENGPTILNMTEGMNPLFSDGELDALKQHFNPDILVGGHQLTYENEVARCVANTGVQKCVLYHPHEKLFNQMKIRSSPVTEVVKAVNRIAPKVEIVLPKPMESFAV